jgi:GT2 family glycosyltransferase
VAFFDDDIVLLPGCLAAMAGGFDQGVGIVGVGAVIENERTSPPTLWRIRRALRIVPSLTPGRYTRSGFQIPWHFLPVTDSLIDGEWLPGGATMWATALAREIGFHEGLDGYASGEDLEFSLQMRRHGRLTMAGMARLLHLQDWGARPNAVQMGYMGLRNLFYIHQEWHRRERARATTAFIYGYGLDTVVRFAALARPGNVAVRWQFIRGRLRFFREVIGMTRSSAG